MYLFHKITAIIFLIILAVQFCSAKDSDTADLEKFRIAKISVHGNKKTKARAIIMLMGLDTGIVIDSVQLRKSEKKLEDTNLFSKVDVLILKRAEGTEVFIIVVEKLYIYPSGGGVFYSYKYGEKDLWLRLDLGLSNINFRGMMENLSTSVSLWDWRSISFSWTKPLLPSDFFFTISSGVDYYPDDIEATNHFAFNNRFRFGKKIKSRSRVSLGVNPSFKRDIYTIQTKDENSNVFTREFPVETKEVFSSLFWISDYRKPFYDPYSGWLGYAEIKSNHLYPGKFNSFVQMAANLSIYHTGIMPDHKIAFRFHSVLRDRNAGPFHLMQLGGTGSLRGYSNRALGLYINGENSLLASMEYRFPLLHLPPIDIPILSQKNRVFAAIRQRIDGALIFDYGRVTEEIDDLFGIGNGPAENGAGIGFGLRVMILNLERSLALDIIWGKDNTTEMLKFRKIPVCHAYIDLYF